MKSLRKHLPSIIITGIILGFLIWVANILTTPEHERSHSETIIFSPEDSNDEDLFPLTLKVADEKTTITSRRGRRQVTIEPYKNGHVITAFRMVDPYSIIQVHISHDKSTATFVDPDQEQEFGRIVANVFHGAFTTILWAHERYHDHPDFRDQYMADIATNYLRLMRQLL